jgi:two-component system NtrC family response regulator
MANILIIDDDPKICQVLARVVHGQGHATQSAHTLARGLEMASEGGYDVVFLDLRLPDGHGLDILPSLLAVATPPEVIIITGAGDPKAAEMAFQSGAWAYVTKPFVMDEVVLPLARALQYRQEKQASQTPRLLRREGIIGDCPPMQACLEKVAQAAGSMANVLITGETGTGKELFARAIHDNSPRAEGNFVVVDCTALPETLVESLLFGHQRGAFTGAEQAREGLVSQAHGGTLFLDEVGELPPSVQKTFLRVLQEHRYLPLGAKRELASDFRLVAATNRDLEQMTGEKRFRQDLLFRIRSLSIQLPPLRQRSQDMKNLIVQLLAKLCTQYHIQNKGFSPEFHQALAAYPWPGNVRELINALDSALAASGGHPNLYPIHLPPAIRLGFQYPPAAPDPPPLAGGPDNLDALADGPDFPTLRQHRKATEGRYLTALMERAGGGIKRAMALSGLSESRLHALLKAHQTPRPSPRQT